MKKLDPFWNNKIRILVKNYDYHDDYGFIKTESGLTKDMMRLAR